MQQTSVTMVHQGPLSHRTCPDQPSGFRIRGLQPREAEVWAQIETAVNEFDTADGARQRFSWEFLPFPRQIPERCLLVETADGEPVGTASAWYDCQFQGQLWGRLHWVAILPDYQGKGLARPLLGQAMNRLALFHSRAFLDTDTKRIKAIKLYLDHGFVPHVRTERDEQAWQYIRQQLSHPVLDSMPSSPGGEERRTVQ